MAGDDKELVKSTGSCIQNQSQQTLFETMFNSLPPDQKLELQKQAVAGLMETAVESDKRQKVSDAAFTVIDRLIDQTDKVESGGTISFEGKITTGLGDIQVKIKKGWFSFLR